MDPTTLTPEQTRIRIDALRTWAESAAESAYWQTAGALNAAHIAHAQRHAGAAATEARAARAHADEARRLAKTLSGDCVTVYLMVRDADSAAERASLSAGTADRYANGHPSHRENAQKRADTELIQATESYLTARRHRQQVGAQTPDYPASNDPQNIAYAKAQERERQARARLEHAQRMTETDPDSLSMYTDNDDAPPQE